MAAIDEALKGHASFRSVAKTFALGRTCVKNHAGHLGVVDTRQRSAAAQGRLKRPRRIALLPVAPIATAEDVVADLQRLRVEAYTLFEQAKGRSDWKSAERVFGQLVDVVDRFGEMHRVLGGKGSVVNVTLDNSRRVLNVLGGLPEAQLRGLLERAERGEPIALEAVG